MTDRPLPRPKPTFLESRARPAVLARLAGIRAGELALVDAGETHRFGATTAACPLSATLEVRDPAFWAEVAFGGSVGAGESYMQGHWAASDLTAAMRILLANRAVLDGMETGLARLFEPARKLLHALNRNSRTGSRRNIAAHYDLGNDFFALFLDPSMMYSCALYERPGLSLAEAQAARLQRVCQRLQLGPADHLLEIGTGWGGFAIHAARHTGCRVTTTTISSEQHALAAERIAAAGLTGRITLLKEDYRDLRGTYDKLVSLEMVEAVGHAYYDAYFGACARLLGPAGTMLLQAITIADQRYDAARRSVDFIQRHIFPGSCIPSVAAIAASVARATDLRIVRLEDIGPHYATTLRHWRENLFANLERVRALGYPPEFIRMWEFYLCYCEAGFAERALGDVHLLLAKPGYRGTNGSLSAA